MSSVCLCTKYQSNRKESHILVVKKIIKYINHTRDFELWYLKESHFDLCAYTYADFVRSKYDRKSTSGAYYFLGNYLVYWQCKKQNSIALLTTEAKYISTGTRCVQILWINTLEDYGFTLCKTILYCDSSSATRTNALRFNIILFESMSKIVMLTYNKFQPIVN